MVFLLLWLACSCESAVQDGGEVTCQSVLSGGSCNAREGRSCPRDDAESCYSKRPPSPPIYDNVDGHVVTQCKPGNVCGSQYNLNEVTPENTLTGVNAVPVAFDPDYYSVNVSWTVSNTSNFYDGYVVKLFEWKPEASKSEVPKRCYCIQDPSVLNIDFLYLEYNKHDEYMSVEVEPYPLPGDLNYVSNSKQEVRPKGCADTLVGNNTVCGAKRYGAATDISVQSSVTCNDTKELRISWEHSSLPVGNPHPPSYYLYVYSERSLKHLFKVDNATSVVLKNLNISLNYVIKLQAYGKCSGLGDHKVSSIENLGCGKNSITVAENSPPSEGCYVPDTTVSTSPPITSSIPTENMTVIVVAGAVQTSPSSELSLLLLLLLLLPVVLVLLVLTAVFCRVSNRADSGASKKKELLSRCDHKVFVFYCSSLVQEHKIYIQQHIVQPLSLYFHVLTPDDFARGDIGVWLEEQVRESDSVLLVTNEEFCSQWSQEKEREPILNSLQHIISAATGTNTLSKFGVVFTEGTHQEVCIPNCLYLQLLPIFEMSKRVCEVEKIYLFVTGSKQFAFGSSPGSTPTEVGPAHLAANNPNDLPCTDGTSGHLSEEPPTHVAVCMPDSPVDSPTTEGPVHVAVYSADCVSCPDRATTDDPDNTVGPPRHVTVCISDSPDSSPTAEGPEHIAVCVSDSACR